MKNPLKDLSQKRFFTPLFIAATLLLFLFLSYHYLEIKNVKSERVEGYQGRELICLEFLEQGTLYGKQPFCLQGPVLYMSGYLLKTFFGPENLQSASKIVHSLFMIASFYVFLLIFWKEAGKKKWITPLILYLAFLWYPSLSHLEMSLAVFFLLVGYYFLFHSQVRMKELFAGLFFSFSLLAKLSSVYLVIAFMLLKWWQIFRKSTLHKKESTSSLADTSSLSSLLRWLKEFKPLFILGIATALPMLLFFLKYPFAFTMLVTIPKLFISNADSLLGISTFQSYVQAIQFLFSPHQIITNIYKFSHLYHFSIVSLFLLNFYGLFKYRKRIFFVAIPAFFTFIETIRMYSPMESLTAVDSYYSLPALGFLLMGVGVLLADTLTSVQKRKTLLLVLVGLLALGLYNAFPLVGEIELSHLWQATDADRLAEFRELVEKPIYAFLSSQYSIYKSMSSSPSQQRVLISTGFSDTEFEERYEYLQWLNPNIFNHLDRVRDPDRVIADAVLIDPGWGSVSYLIGGEEAFKKFIPTFTGMPYQEQLDLFTQRIIQGEYQLIIMAQPQVNFPILENKTLRDMYLVKTYIPVTFLTLRYARENPLQKNSVLFLFKERSEVEKLLIFMVNYYQQHFQEICEQDGFTGQFLLEILISKGIDLNKTCTSSSGSFLSIEEMLSFRMIFALLLVFCFYLFTSGIKSVRERRKSEEKIPS